LGFVLLGWAASPHQEAIRPIGKFRPVLLVALFLFTYMGVVHRAGLNFRMPLFQCLTFCWLLDMGADHFVDVRSA
jgi:hypothetical protein